MEIKFWISLIIGAIYILTKLRGKSEDSSSDDTNYEPSKKQTPPSRQQPAKGLTFEELLREINDAKSAQKPQNVAPQPTPYIDYDDDLEEEAQSLETIPTTYKNSNTAFDAYKGTTPQAFAHISLEESMKLADTDVTFGKFKAFEEKPQTNFLEKYTRELQDPDGFKKAFIMSEILQRKY